MIFVTKEGQVLFAKKDDVPIQGRISGGVRGINLNDKDKLIYGSVCTDDGELLVVTRKGMAKRVPVAQIDKLPRYRKGVRLVLLAPKDVVIYAERITLPVELVFEYETTKMINSEDILIEARTTKGKKLKGIDELKGVYLAK